MSNLLRKSKKEDSFFDVIKLLKDRIDEALKQIKEDRLLNKTRKFI